MIYVRRRADPPNGLAGGSKHAYRLALVRAALNEDFHGKCYLCERRSASLDIEHLRPQASFPDERNVWQNLLLACSGSCNPRRIRWDSKPNAEVRDGVAVCWPRGGLLDPSGDADLEVRLMQRMEFVGTSVCVAFAAVDPDDLAAANTAAELNQIHDDDPRGRVLREEIRREYLNVSKALARWVLALRRASQVDELMARRVLRRHLADDAVFAGLFRAAVREELKHHPELLRELGLSPQIEG